jgi:pyranose oxidase
LLEEAKNKLNVHSDQYDHSIRHTVVKDTLMKAFPNRGITNLPLAVHRNSDNPDYVTWTGTNTILGKTVESSRFTLSPEVRVTKVIRDTTDPGKIVAAKVRDLRTDHDQYVIAKVCNLFF